MNARTMLSRLLLFATLLLVGCVSPKNRARIDQIVDLMEEQPQKALECFEQLDRAQFNTRKAQADRDLLYAILLDKNYIDLNSDSLILRPYHFYSRHAASDSIRYLIHYYRARVYQNGGDFGEAAHEYLTAHSYLSKDNHYKNGLHYNRLAEMYYLQKNYPHALKNYQKAYECYQKAGREHSVTDAIGSIANVLAALRRYDEAEKWYQQAIAACEKNGNPDAEAVCLGNLLLLYVDTADSQATFRYFDQLQSLGEEYLNATSYLCMANACLIENRLEEAKAYLEKGERYPLRGSEALLHYLRARIATLESDFKQANEHQLRFLISSDSLRNRNYAESVAETERLFYAHLSQDAQQLLRVKNIVTTLIVVLTIGLVSGILLIHRRRVRRKEKEINTYISTAEQLQAQYNYLKERIDDNAEEFDQCRYLLAEYFTSFDELCLPLFERNTKQTQREALYEEVQKRLKALTADPKTQSNLELIVNAAHRNLMRRLSAQIPHITENDRSFLLLVYAGFSAQVISLATQETVANVYARKYRIKQRIKKSDAPDKEDFIAAFR